MFVARQGLAEEATRTIDFASKRSTLVHMCGVRSAGRFDLLRSPNVRHARAGCEGPEPREDDWAKDGQGDGYGEKHSDEREGYVLGHGCSELRMMVRV